LLHGAQTGLQVTGTWRFASDFGEFRSLRADGTGAATARFCADSVGEGEITMEFYPHGCLKPAVSASFAVRALDWSLWFESPRSMTADAGSHSTSFTAMVTDGSGAPVTDPGARVRFNIATTAKIPGIRRKQVGLARRPADSLLTVVYDGRKVGVNYGSPDQSGLISAVFEAGDAPGRDTVQAVLYYDDDSGMQAHPKIIAVSHTVRVDVVPRQASFIAWEPAEAELTGMSPADAVYNWYDAYGNRTEAADGMAVFVQVPERLPFEIKAAGDWVGPGQWLELVPGQKLQFRAAAGTEVIHAGTYLVNTKVEGAAELPPAGLGQANRPLKIVVDTDIVLPREKMPWLREVGAAIGRLAAGFVSWIREMMNPAARGVST
jgi:hypothetical protein